ncbi:MAG: tetratricopeptide repeat protein [Bacteroidota bacterium]|nr:tetratricopeptide repeat protein [Bacteroidota bacterium]
MRYFKKIGTFCFVLLLSCIFAPAQNIDSLKFALKTSKHDTSKCTVLSLLAEIAPEGEWEKFNEQLYKLTESNLKTCSPKQPAFKIFKKFNANALNNMGHIANQKGETTRSFDYYNKSLQIMEEIGDKLGSAELLNNLGLMYQNTGQSGKAQEYYTKSLNICEELKDKEGMSYCLNNLGYTYQNNGDIKKALDYYTQSLKIREELGDKQMIASVINNIGTIYKDQGDNTKALEYYSKNLKLYEEIGDKNGMAFSLNNMGFVYDDLGEFKKAIDCYERSLALRTEVGDKSDIAISLSNIAGIYYHHGDPSCTSPKKECAKIGQNKALEYYTQSLKIREAIGDKEGIANSLGNIGFIYSDQKNYKKALEYLNRAMKLSKELGYPEGIANQAERLMDIYKETGNYQKALENYELFIQMKDSINNEDTRKASLKQQFKYEYEKRAAADSVAHAKETDIKNLELQKQQAEIKAKRYTQYALFGGLALVIIFAGFIFNRFKITQKQKVLIDIQKRVVEEAHKEIIDSINYAERLQRSLMASAQLLNQNIGNYFVYFNPKEAVSGDFYWASTLRNGNFCLVAADSTGHGVPGAIMSMMNMNSLKESVKENLSEPHEILNKTRNIIIATLANDGSMEGGKDGMDAALIVFDSQKTKAEFSLANNPLWLIRKGELIEYKPDKMPVGKHDRQDVPFSKQEILLEKGDTIYILTDGYADQFGGERGKKFMYKPLKELLLSVQDKTMSEQREVLSKRFEEWKGDMEQIDDVCVIGIKI